MTPKYRPPDIGQMSGNNIGPASGWSWQWLREKVSAIGFRAMADGGVALRQPAWEGMRSQAAQRWQDIRQLWSSFALTRWLVLLGAAGRGRTQRLRQTLLRALQAALMVGLLAQPLVAYADTPTPKGGEFRVNTYTPNDQCLPSVAMDADGDFVVAWEGWNQDGSGPGVYAQRYNSSGVAQGGEFRINTYTTDDQQFPSAAMDADGDFVVAWESDDQDGDYWGVYAQRYNSGGVAQGSEFRINTYTTGDQWVPSVAMDADGDFVVAWMSDGQDGSNNGVYARRYNSSGVAQGGEFRVNTYTTNEQRSPNVAMDADGDFVVAWRSYNQDGSNNGVYARRYNSSGVAQGGEFRVNTYTTGDQRSSSVAMDADGDFVVAWQSYSQDGDYWGVYARRYNANGTAKDVSEFRVNTYTTGSQWSPSVALDADGDFVVAWTDDYDGYGYGVYAQRYNANGTPDGSEFQVNTYTTDNQEYPSVALDTDGDFVVAWDSWYQDGDWYGVYAQLYAPPPTADLSIAKRSEWAGEAGTPITYTITVRNAGPSEANSTNVSDTLPTEVSSPSWKCQSGGASCGAGSGAGDIDEDVDLPSGGMVTFTVTGTVTVSDTVVNTATVSAPAGISDPNTGNNQSVNRSGAGGPTYLPIILKNHQP